MMKIDKLSGVEPHQIIDEWYETVTMNAELVKPGAAKALEDAEKMKVVFSTEDIGKRTNSIFELALSKEMYVFMKCFTALQARTLVNSVESGNGLEAWRVVKQS